MKPLHIDIQWGGYYAFRAAKDESYGVFRLLNFNRDAYHAALFSETFDRPPTMSEIESLSPLVGHVPIDVRGFLQYHELQLAGAAPLTLDDLEGYRVYLEELEVADADAQELLGRLIAFSLGPPLKLTLDIMDEQLVIMERQ